MFLADTNVISETRREERANEGVRAFFDGAQQRGEVVFLSVVTVGELRRGVESLRNKGDVRQAAIVEAWLKRVLRSYQGKIVPVDRAIGELWGRIRARHPEPAVDRLIAATALARNLTVVTRNVRDFERVGVKMLNPFE
ncbi:type II toxin-antitoxin system VapC family toxin [Caballeronia sp. NK8]|uniref:type II toxin-antitoxin system VapC family toxin n=1 Tax=Caballeronia sp. NK8 TaxID=140098 RepID=UPI001BB58804|nr:type II toxin-antitoxin system VapC family toxin [Caballeronia sp. NK8]BCQ21981.1 type II toxin-antitoxin system VapC family toxin [Caballeronia sp. NK8]